jgi:hypothetical protein
MQGAPKISLYGWRYCILKSWRTYLKFNG